MKNKIKYIISALLVVLLTFSFMLIPNIYETINTHDLSSANIKDVDLASSQQRFTPQQILNIIENSGNPNFLRIKNSKSDDGFIADCEKICNNMYSNKQFSDAIIADIKNSKTKEFSTIKYVSLYEDEIVSMNIVICGFKGIGFCYEEQNLLPILIEISETEIDELSKLTSQFSAIDILDYIRPDNEYLKKNKIIEPMETYSTEGDNIVLGYTWSGYFMQMLKNYDSGSIYDGEYYDMQNPYYTDEE